MGNWFPSKSRGRIMGFWGTASPMGNIVGSLLSPIILLSLGLSWKVLIFLSGSFLIIVGISVTFLEDLPNSSITQPLISSTSQPKFLEIFNLPG